MLNHGTYEKGIILWVVMSMRNSEKIRKAKVRLLSREFGVVKCITHLSGLILLVSIYFFSQEYWKENPKQVIAITFL